MSTKTKRADNNFYALLRDNGIKKITLTQEVSEEVKNIFVNAAIGFKEPEVEEIEFDGNYRVDPDEILYVNFALPDLLREAISNPISVGILKLDKDEIQSLFWVEQKPDNNDRIYFQNFDARKVLQNKHILTFSAETYTKLDANAFIIDETIAAIFEDGKLYFKSYSNANKIFNLSEFYQEATDADIDAFSRDKSIQIDVKWFKENSNSSVRKQITLIQKSKILKSADINTIKKRCCRF